MSIESIVVGL